MIRVFLDANVLFSAAWHENSRMNDLWGIRDLQFVSSDYAVAEARRNIVAKRSNALNRLDKLLGLIEISNLRSGATSDPGLPEKDLPILEAALGAACSYLLTGDVAHFGSLFGSSVSGVTVLTPGAFLKKISGRD